MRPLLCQLASSVRTSQVIENGGGGEEDGEGSCCHVILRTTAGPALRGLALRGGGVVSELHEDEELDSEAGSEEGGQGVRGGGRDAGALSVDTSEEDSGDGEDDSGDSHETEKRGARTDGQRRKLAAGRKRGRVASSSDVSEGDSDEGERQGASDEEENEDDEEEERAGGGSSNPAPAKQKSAGKGFGSEYQDLDVGEDVTALSFHPLTSIIAIGTVGGSVQLWEYGRAEHSYLSTLSAAPGSPPVRHLTFSLDGKKLFSGYQDGAVCCSDFQSMDSHGQLPQLWLRADAHDAAVSNMLPLPDGSLVTSSDAGEACLWRAHLTAAKNEIEKNNENDNDKQYKKSKNGNGNNYTKSKNGNDENYKKKNDDQEDDQDDQVDDQDEEDDHDDHGDDDEDDEGDSKRSRNGRKKKELKSRNLPRRVEEEWRVQLNSEAISSSVYSTEHSRLLLACSDGSFALLDPANGLALARCATASENGEALCLALVADDTKVLCGYQSGSVGIWKWGAWEGESDFLPGHIQAVNCMVAVDEDTIVTASDDGLVRLMQVHPNKLVAVLGAVASDVSALRNKGEGDLPAELLSVDFSSEVAAFSAMDSCVKFADLTKYALDEAGQTEADGDSEVEEGGSRRRRKRKKTRSQLKKKQRLRSKVKGLLASAT